MPKETFKEKKEQIIAKNAKLAAEREKAKKRLKVMGGLAGLSVAISYVLTGCSEGTSPISPDEFVPPKDPVTNPTEISPEASPNPEAPTTTSDAAPEETGLPDGIEEVEVEAVPTPTEMVMPTEIVPQFTRTPEIRNFRESYVSEEELLDGSYWNWLNEVIAPTLLEEFKAREDQIRDDVPMRVVGLGTGSVFFYPNEGVYIDEETTAPWNRKVTFAATSCKHRDGRTLECLVLPVFYYNKETQQIFPVVTIQPIYHEEKLEAIMNAYLEEMNMPLIVYSNTTGVLEKENINITAPLVNQSYDRLGQDEVWERTKRFYEGDVSAFSGPDMLLRSIVVKGKFFQ